MKMRRLRGPYTRVASRAGIAMSLALTAACAVGTPGRSLDDRLLERPDLQSVVDLTLGRDAGALLERLGDPDPAVRRRAALGLGAVRSGTSVDPLSESLGDPEPAVREAAAFALGQLRSPVASPPLLQHLAGERDPSVRRRIIEALGKAGGGEALRGLVALSSGQAEEGEIVLALAHLALADLTSEASLDRLVAGLTHRSETVRWRAAWYFGRVAVPTRWRALAPEVRAALDGFEAADPAAAALVTGLSRLGDPADTPRLLFWLEEGQDWQTRHAAATALTPRVDDPRASEALFIAIDDPNPHVGVAAATAVSTLATPSQADLEAMELRLDALANDPLRAFPLLAAFTTRGRPEVARAWLETHGPRSERAAAAAWSALTLQPGAPGLDAAFEAIEGGGAAAVAAVEALGQRWPSDRGDPVAVARVYEALSRTLRGGPRAAVGPAIAMLADPAFLPLGVGGFLRDWAARLDPGTRRWEVGQVRAVLETVGEDVSAVPQPGPLPRRSLDWADAAARGTSPRLTLETEAGTIVVQLETAQAPLTVTTFLELAASGRLNGTPFHRVVPRFVAQGGDVEGGAGSGGPGYTIRTEPTLIPFDRGVIGMASAGPDTEGSQFFLMHAPAPHLDGAYTAFGRVVDGLDVLDRIQQGALLLSARVE